MDARREYVSSRKDVAVIGGTFGREKRMSFGGEVYLARTDADEPKMVVFANAYEATDADGRKSLFLVRSLVPMEYHKVVPGKTYKPKVTKKGELRRTPPVESFPSVIHGTNLTRMDLSKRLVQDGVYDEIPELRATILLVCLGQGLTDPGEWTEDACVEMLATMRSGDMSSATLNQDGRMSVEVVCEMPDMASVATESVIAMDAFIRRMEILHGEGSALHGSWQDELRKRDRFGGYRGLGLLESLSGNILHSLPSFLIQELDGDAKSVIGKALPSLRLRESLEARRGRQGQFPTMTMHCDDARAREMFVSLCAMADPDEHISVKLESYATIPGTALATELGPVIEDDEEARRVLSAAVSSLWRGEHQNARLCVSALLGNDWGRRLVTERETGRLPVATEMLLCSTDATEWGDDAWGDWVARNVRDIVGSVAYAEAVRELIDPACERHELDDAWEVVNPVSQLDEADATTDWHLLAERARECYAEWQAKGEERITDPDPCGYGEWDDCDWEDWDSGEDSLYRVSDADDSLIWKADRFACLCRLFHVCRHAFRYLDGMGWRTLLDTYPVLRMVANDDGTPATLHNDVVAASCESLFSLVAEDGYDIDGRPTGATFPSVTMDDGSVMGIHAETAPDGGYVGRVTCDGGDACYLFPADVGSFESIDAIARFLFSVSVSLPEGDEEDGQGDDLDSETPTEKPADGQGE